MVKPGDIIKSPKFWDICYLITDMYDDRVAGMILNMGFEKTYWTNERFNHSLSEITDFLLCTDSSVRCVRYSKWIPLNNKVDK